MNENRNRAVCQAELLSAAADCFKALAEKINDYFKKENLVGKGGVNNVIKTDIAKVESLKTEDKYWQKAFEKVFVYYEKLIRLMDTLIVADEDAFENLKLVCGHFHIPQRIFIKFFVNCDVSMMLSDKEKLQRILKNDLM